MSQYMTPEEYARNYIDFFTNNGKYIKNKLTVEDVREDINWVYNKSGLKEPKHIIIADTWFEELLMIEYLQGHTSYLPKHNNDNENSKSFVDPIFANNVIAKIKGIKVKELMADNASVKKAIKDFELKMRTASRKELPVQLLSKGHKPLREDVSSIVVSNIFNIMLMSMEDYKNNYRYEAGLPENSWMVFHSYYRYHDAEQKIPKNEDFDRFYSFINGKGIWTIEYFKDVCILVQMPSRISLDGRNRIHSADGPAVEWRYESRVIDPNYYYLRGLKFEKSQWEQIVTGKIGMNDVFSEKNQERRNAMLSTVGYDKIFNKIPNNMKRLIDKAYTKPKIKVEGTEQYPIELWSIDMNYFRADTANNNRFGQRDVSDDAREVRMVRYKCSSTGREYVDNVPLRDTINGKQVEINDAIAAIAWKFGMSRDEYLNEMVAES